MSEVHPTAVVAGGARLAAGARVGPYCVIGPEVEIGEGCELIAHVVVAGRTRIGARTRVFPFASLGHEPQDMKYAGEPSTLVIGDDCTIREHVTMNPGTAGGDMTTVVGKRCLFLAGAHVAHDCRVGDGVILSNAAMIAGHSRVGDHAILGGGAGVHQFVRIGAHAFVGGMSALENDVIPYGMALGNRAYLAGLNVVGLRRRGFDKASVHELRRAYRLLFAAEGTLKERVEDVGAEFEGHALVGEVLTFIREGGERALCVPRAQD